jgi:dihydroorotate dehydrogenase
VPPCGVPADPRLTVDAFGLRFPNPLGMAAGFDKDAEVPDALLRLGYGFTEVGTLTPRAQEGNPKPRVFRLADDHALINRLGFNSEGHDAVHARLARRTRRGVVGVNVGANKDSPDRIADYAAGVARFADVADYIAVNISSPNTPGWRALHEADDLKRLLNAVMTARDKATRRVPLLVKISPDLDDDALAAVVHIVGSSGIEGLIVTNTTVDRDEVAGDRHAGEAGGLSGRPLYQRSNIMLAKVRRLAGRDLVLVGVGGVDSTETAFAKILAGADLVQLYTGLVFEGPGLAVRIVSGLTEELVRNSVPSIADIVGGEVDFWADVRDVPRRKRGSAVGFCPSGILLREQASTRRRPRARPRPAEPVPRARISRSPGRTPRHAPAGARACRCGS